MRYPLYRMLYMNAVRTNRTPPPKPLCDVAEVRLGFQARGALQFDPKGEWCLVQIKDIEGRRQLRIDNLSRLQLDGSAAGRYRVSEGDVLFLSRGRHNFAIAIADAPSKTMAAGYFFIVRPQPTLVLPEYLAWYINQPPAQEFLHSKARRGSHMPIVTKAAFEELPVVLPPLATQRTIVKLNALAQQEQHLLAEIQCHRATLLQSLCLQSATRA